WLTERAERQPLHAGTKRACMQHHADHGNQGDGRSALVARVGNQQEDAAVGKRQKIIIIAAGPPAHRVVDHDLPAYRLGYLAWQQLSLELGERLKLSLQFAQDKLIFFFCTYAGGWSSTHVPVSVDKLSARHGGDSARPPRFSPFLDPR